MASVGVLFPSKEGKKKKKGVESRVDSKLEEIEPVRFRCHIRRCEKKKKRRGCDDGRRKFCHLYLAPMKLSIQPSFHDLNAFICLLFRAASFEFHHGIDHEKRAFRSAVFSSYENNTFKYQNIALELNSLFLFLCFFLFRLYRAE